MIIDDFVGNFVATTRDKNLVFCRKFSCHRVGQQARLALRMWPQPWKFCEPFFGQLENLFLENLLIFYSHHMKTHKRHENFEIFPWGVIVEIISSYLKKVFILSFTYIFESRCTIKFPWISKKKNKLGRHALHRVRSVWKSLDWVGFGSKKISDQKSFLGSKKFFGSK